MMDQHSSHDDASHYEVSLTAGQAFIAFVLLLFSLAAAFAFGVIVGNGQFDDSTAAAAGEPSGRTATAQQAKIHEIEPPVEAERKAPPRQHPAPVIIEERAAATPGTEPMALAAGTPPSEEVAHFAQILSTTDAKAAETLATRLIDQGFTSAHVERSSSPRGTVHRVRVRFPSASDARDAVPRLRPFAPGEVWISAARPATEP